MNEIVNYQLRGQVAMITMECPPVNSLGYPLRVAILRAIERANKDEAARAIVLTGTPGAFSAGADINEFNTAEYTCEPRVANLVRIIEDNAKPVVAAIAGICFGGGFELALAAHFRVAHEDAKLALPEVKLGLLPGAGGTQRLPRLVGLDRALNIILSGDPVRARQMTETRLLDLVTDGDVVAAAEKFATSMLADRRPFLRTRDLDVADEEGDALIETAHNTVAGGKDLALLPARRKCVEALAASYSKSFDEGSQLEREGFLSLVQSVEAKALRHIFEAQRTAAKLDALPKDANRRTIAKVGVIGAGTMGGGITMNFLNAGLPVVLVESSQQALDRGLATIRRNYETSMKKGKVTAADVERRMALIMPTLDYAPLRDANLVIEAVFEEMGVKEQVFRRLDKVCMPGAILASNTSYLDIDGIAGFTNRPGDVLGLHFFSPANVMRLLEIVRGAKTAPDVLATCLGLAKKIDKIAVISGVCDGFIGNRMVARYQAAAHGAVIAGALPQQVDRALQEFGLAMGPLRMGDLAGLDIGHATRKRRAAEAGVPMIPWIHDKLVEAGRLGQKTGAGWYRYEPGTRDPIPDIATEKIIADYQASHDVQPRKVGDEEIVQRCMFALVNEGARILEEGIAARASDIDLVYLNGYGYPPQRGGPMFYADTVGLSTIVRELRRFAAEPGADAWWQPASLLVSLAEQGKTFNGK
ncbi:3-hydroxyacyl-CoA dehydrogenase NAD-binding domain-containing protein [Caenimonas soli]|uniref:3-hydroxyacyl-CoA dehydrogenase NAD-binding domain-containing protein n=1 Tax=Caenimonas soli TaxID=2735555 RepID=UPI001552768A|nr:3-hydroxyacyl-CoA dehydrogenase NAD-binding domain-containing protein [Caenimonas soli]NPC58172.1 3-hydroxyacyl-CoA dehydrogenase [Caenimonas soli]